MCYRVACWAETNWQKHEHPILMQLQSVGTVRNISCEMVEPTVGNAWLDGSPVALIMLEKATNALRDCESG
jgi:hypothetical protein